MGGGRVPILKKTKNKIFYKSRQRLIYSGARGGLYVKVNGDYERIKKST